MWSDSFLQSMRRPLGKWLQSSALNAGLVHCKREPHLPCMDEQINPRKLSPHVWLDTFPMWTTKSFFSYLNFTLFNFLHNHLFSLYLLPPPPIPQHPTVTTLLSKSFRPSILTMLFLSLCLSQVLSSGNRSCPLARAVVDQLCFLSLALRWLMS